MFGKMFGGDRFEDLIGTISIGKDMKEAYTQHEEEEDEMMMAPNGKMVLTPAAAQRKAARDRAKAEEVRFAMRDRG